MSVTIRHNIGYNYIHNNLYYSGKEVAKSVERISSGYRINSAADGPSDLTASESLRAQMKGLERAISNTSAAGNIMSTAEGSLSEMNKILKGMKSAALKAASTSSPSEIAAAQTEFDNGYQALDRIINSSKFGDKFLLNGAQEIFYSVGASGGGTQNNIMIDRAHSHISQIFKKDGFKISVSFNGKTSGGFAAGNIGDAAMRAQAAKPYLEIDPVVTTGLLDAYGKLNTAQSFDILSAKGSRHYEFSAGASLADIVAALAANAGATGVRATLTFNRNQAVNVSTGDAAATAVGKGGTGATAANAALYDNHKVDNGVTSLIADSVTGIGGVAYGKNTDGNGDVYVKVVERSGAKSYEVYKDASLSRESLVASGADGAAASALNNSGLQMTVTLNAAASAGDVFRVSLGNVNLKDGVGENTAVIGNDDGNVDFAASTASGVRLGANTDRDGKLYLKFENDGTGKYTVSAFNDAGMDSNHLVARTAAAVSLADGDTVVLDAIHNFDGSATTGLGLSLKIADASTLPQIGDAAKTMSVRFNHLGARVYADDYGSQSYLGVVQHQGGLFVDYSDSGNPGSGYTIAADGNARVKYGQDATLTVNGSLMKTNGLNLDFSTTEVMAHFRFNEGRSGTTTIAQVGYGEGSLFTKNGSLAFSKSGLDGSGMFTSPYGGADAGMSSLLNNASHASLEIIGSFQGGMQFQLGADGADGSRTVVGIKGLNVATLGSIQAAEDFDGNGMRYTRTLSIADAVGGGIANLGQRPDLAVRIVEQADLEVSALRAQIGAFQANTLDSNENNLRTALTNITQSESDIRDANLAVETVNLTRNLILTNAGIAMTSQLNTQSEHVLKLLGWD